eukprot:TRINITY_DN24680_c0_g1_i5.p1 TRINITY_DN24680_c0_g1~~TRINITY_DN24680_c0_g1_i5.p1  ORF type:complete len:351 (-),score=22.84 TRINITY_DN24680_c0_g1_i5:41-1093(-)
MCIRDRWYQRRVHGNADELMKIYREMILHRRVEIQCDEIYKKKEVRGFCHLMDGQEGVSVGIEAGLTKQDHLITAYRCHGLALGRGISVEKLMGEMMGKLCGASKGKGGSMHMTSKENRFYGGNGIVGAQVPLGTGIAFGIRYEDKKEVCVTMYGDGASNQGQIFEAANMAYLWKLPCIYLCENNLYGMGTATARASATTDHYTRLNPIPGVKGNGQNVFAVRELIKYARQHCINNNGPICIELLTYRYHGHSMSDPGLSYRNRDEVNQVRKERDPILLVKSLLIDNKIASEEELKTIEKETKNLIQTTTEKIRNEAWPDPEKDLLNDIMCVPDAHTFVRNVEYPKSIFP